MKTTKIFGLLLTVGVLAACDMLKNDGEIYNSEESRNTFEEVALDLIDSVNPDDFQALADLAGFIVEEVDDCSNGNIIEKWFNDAVEGLAPIIKLREKSSQLGQGTTYVTYITEEWDKCEWVYSLAPFTGKFTLSPTGTWKQEKSDNLVFVVPDQNGKDCVLTLKKSAKTTTFRAVKFENCEVGSRYDYYWSYDSEKKQYVNQEYRYITYYDGYVDVVIPNRVEVTLTDAGKTMVTIVLEAQASLSGVAVVNYEVTDDVEKAVVSLSTKVSAAGYSVEVEKLKLDKGDASIACNVSKGSKELVRFTSSTKGFTIEDGYPHVSTVSAGIDVLGRVQIKGTGNPEKVARKMDEAWEAFDDGKSDSEILRYVDEANMNLDLGVYFGTNTRQAAIQMDCLFENDQKYGNKYMRQFPVLVFTEGGSKYSFEDYFNEDDFYRVINAAEKLAERFADIYPLEKEEIIAVPVNNLNTR